MSFEVGRPFYAALNFFQFFFKFIYLLAIISGYWLCYILFNAFEFSPGYSKGQKFGPVGKGHNYTIWNNIEKIYSRCFAIDNFGNTLQ